MHRPVVADNFGYPTNLSLIYPRKLTYPPVPYPSRVPSTIVRPEASDTAPRQQDPQTLPLPAAALVRPTFIALADPFAEPQEEEDDGMADAIGSRSLPNKSGRLPPFRRDPFTVRYNQYVDDSSSEDMPKTPQLDEVQFATVGPRPQPPRIASPPLVQMHRNSYHLTDDAQSTGSALSDLPTAASAHFPAVPGSSVAVGMPEDVVASPRSYDKGSLASSIVCLISLV
jgi:hypothetical protein